MNEWAFLMLTIPDINNLFQPLEDAIRYQLLPALTGSSSFSDAERESCWLFQHGMEGLAFPNLPDLLAGSLRSVSRSQLPLWISSCLRSPLTSSRCSWNRGRSKPSYTVNNDLTLIWQGGWYTEAHAAQGQANCDTASQWKGSILLAHCHPSGKVWVQRAQAAFQGCPAL